MEIAIHILCHTLPPDTFETFTRIQIGIQKRDEVIDLHAVESASELTLRAACRVAPRPDDGAPNFLGPYAHGTPRDRFLYVVWLGMDHGLPRRFRRAKLRLNHLSWTVIERAANEAIPLVCRLRCTDARGGPTCATPPADFVSWSLAGQPLPSPIPS